MPDRIDRSVLPHAAALWDPRAICYHEAGHAVAAVRLGVRVHLVTVVPDGSPGNLGRTRTAALDAQAPLWTATGWDAFERDAMIELAGPLAEEAFGCSVSTWTWQTHRAQAARAALARWPGAREADAACFVAWYEHRTRERVAAWQPAIISLAAALFARGTLDEAEVAQAMFPARGASVYTTAQPIAGRRRPRPAGRAWSAVDPWASDRVVVYPTYTPPLTFTVDERAMLNDRFGWCGAMAVAS